MMKNVQMWAKQRREDRCGRRHEYGENDEEQEEVFKLYIQNNILHLRMTPITKTTHTHTLSTLQTNIKLIYLQTTSRVHIKDT